MLRRWPLLWLSAVLAVGCLRAETSTTSALGHSATVTITFDATGVSWTRSMTDGGSGHSWAGLYIKNDGGNQAASGWGTPVFDTISNSSPGNVSGHSVLSPGQYVVIGTAVQNGSNVIVANDGGSFHPTWGATIYGPFVSAEPTYGITVKLPANTTALRKLYFAMQNGEQVGWAIQEAGAAARDWYIGNLDSDDSVSVVEVTGGTLDSYPGESGLEWVKTSGTETTAVSVGQPTSAEPTPGSGATAEVEVTGGGTQAAPSNPATETPEAPAPTSNPSAPTSTTTPTAPTSTTPFTPSGGDPVTKADAEAVANKQIEATDKVAAAVHAGAAAGVTATDKVATAVWEAGKKATEATDKVSTSVWESGKKQIEATDKVAAAVDKSRGELSGKMTQMIEKQNAMLGAQNTTNSKLDEIKEALEATDDKEAAQTAADAAVASAATSSAAAVTGITGALPSAVNDLPYSPEVGGGSGAFLSIEMPSAFGGATVNFNPFANEAMAAIAAWFRSATAWLCYLLLGQFVFGQLRAALDTVATARQASGNPVFGGTGGQATAAVNAGLLTAAALVAVAALAAWAFEGINIAGLVSNLTASPLVGMSANVFWFLDQFLPCATLITCAVARAAWHLYSGPVIATYITVCRWFIA